MNRSRIVILGVAVLAAIGAGYIAKGMSSTPPAQQAAAPVEQQPRIETRDVLLISQQVNIGDRVGAALKWQAWPANTVDSSFITRESRPEALEELKDAIARYTLYPGEPVRLERLVTDAQNFLSAILTPGMRAVAIEIAADTSAGGFILPNDHVDIIMTRRSEDTANGPGYITETVLQNIRVLAIDQTVQNDEDGNPVIIGKTATMEVTPEQAEVIIVAQQMANRLALALRSAADLQEPSARSGRHLVNGVNGSGIRMIKSGEMNIVGARQ
jgi:pilus assembly protein CpaB